MKLVGFLSVLACAFGAGQSFAECDVIRINEIRIDQPGADLDEYVELVGPPGASLNNVSYVVIGDLEGTTPPNQNGGIEAVVNLSGFSIGRDGIFVIGEPTLTLGTPDLAVSLNFEQSDNVTHLLVTNFSGAVNQDLDTNNDGVLDVTPWSSILCSVALVNNLSPNGITSEYYYSPTVVGPDGTSTPSQAWLCNDTLAWNVGQFDPAALTDTVGVLNPDCEITGNDTLQINEIRIDQSGADDDEYFELSGPNGTSLDGVSLLVIGDASSGPAGVGVVEELVDLTGFGIGGSGFFLVAEDLDTFGAEAQLLDDLNFENGDTVSFFLVRDFTGALNDDLDTDNDGVLDIEPWSEVVDSVSLIVLPGPGTDPAYSRTTVGPDGTFVPGHVYRCVPDGTWTVGQFDPVNGQDTPNAANLGCDFVPPCGSSLAGSCFVADQTPNCNDAACCELVCTFDPFCCDEAWDENCVDIAQLQCLDCGDPQTGNCFEPHDSPYCSDGDCCSLVCSIDSTCCNSDWDQACAAVAEQLCLSGGKAPPVILNEIRIDQTSTDNDEYMELFGPPGASLDGVSYVVIGDGAGGSGVVEAVVNLTGLSIPGDGIFLAVETTFSLAPLRNADVVLSGNGLNFENADNVTHMLVFNFTGTDGMDLDTNDDGVLELQPWQEVMDSVSVLNSATSGDKVYSPNQVGPDGSFAPAQIYRCIPDGTWVIGSFDSPGSTDTPGSANFTCKAPPVDANCGEPDAGNCYTPHATPACDTADCCSSVCTAMASCCDMAWDAACVAAAVSICGDPGVPPSGIVINEVRLDQESSDTNEFIELMGPPGTSLDGLAYVVIGDSSAALGSGVLETMIDLTGESIGANGLYLRALPANTLENSDNVTHLLVWGFSGATGTDMDFDDDGILDIVSWVTSVDDVSIVENLDMPPTGTEWWYSPNIVGPDGTFAPGHVYRCTPSGTWTVGQFAPLGVTDTPGEPNLACQDDCNGDEDGDGVNDCDDQCPGFDDSLDADLDGIPNGCEACLADLDNSGTVDGADLGLLLANWTLTGVGDLDGSGAVDGADLGLLLASWGPCL